jgi:hypothetical protein
MNLVVAEQLLTFALAGDSEDAWAAAGLVDGLGVTITAGGVEPDDVRLAPIAERENYFASL